MMIINRFAAAVILTIVLVLSAVQAAMAADEAVTGLWQYREIIEKDVSEPEGLDEEEGQGVLLSDLDAMPLDLLGKVFGKLNYTAAFSGDHRFALEIKVLGMHFHAQGQWSTQDGRMTLVYDEITGFEKLWWLGGFGHLTHCDAEHTMAETVPYTVSEDTLTFYSNGALLLFTRDQSEE